MLSVILLFGSSMSVFAESPNGYTEWNTLDKIGFYAQNFFTFAFETTGVLVNSVQGGSSSATVYDSWEDYLQVKYDIDTSYNYDDYVDKHFNKDESSGEPQYIIDDTMSDDMYSFIKNWMENNTGWYDFYTYTMPDIVTYFGQKPQYDKTVGVINGLKTNEIACVVPYSYTSLGYYTKITILDYDSFLLRSNDVMQKWGSAYKNWDVCNIGYDVGKVYWFDKFGNDVTSNVLDEMYGSSYDSFIGINIGDKDGFFYGSNESRSDQPHLVTRICRTERVFKTINELKNYTVDSRSYLATSKFKDYDTNHDNTVTVSDDALQNGSVYGDVYNYVINNGGDGMTEEELRKLLDEYFGDTGGGSSGGDSGGGTSGGGGLDGLLGGLGAFGDAIMRIAGKLIEYIGKLLELVTTSFTGILDKIPTGFVGLLGALFPFIPEEVISVLGLGITLILIIALIKALKK